MTVSPYDQNTPQRPGLAPAYAPERPNIAKWLIGGGALIVLLGGWWYWQHSGTSRIPRVAAPPVRVALATVGDMPVIERTIGTVVPSASVQITSRVQGIVDEAHFKEGQMVKKGDLLFQIDPRSFIAALAQARATLEKDQAQLAAAANNEKRYRTLYAQNATSSQQLDTAVSTAASLVATVAADKAAVDTAQLNLGYTRITTPVDGKTGPILVLPGNMVAANGTTILVTVNQVSPIKVSFSLPQTDLPLIQAREQTARGLLATVTQDGSDKSLSAKVDFVGNAVNAVNGTIEMRASFDNQDGALVPGQLVNVTVELNDIPGAVIVPHEAINAGPDGSYVYTVDADSRAQQRFITVQFDDGKFAALKGDIKQGDKVIIDGQLRVVPDSAVEIEGAVQRLGAGRRGRRGGRGGRGRRAAAE
jgi:multidrug efflux system membrane fusion protein